MSASPPRQSVDRDVLVCAHDVTAGAKHARTKALLTSLWESREGCLSLQGLQEFYVEVARKVARRLASAVSSQTWQLGVSPSLM